eukprot:765134-Hanusia_phi.AAC.5
MPTGRFNHEVERSKGGERKRAGGESEGRKREKPNKHTPNAGLETDRRLSILEDLCSRSISEETRMEHIAPSCTENPIISYTPSNTMPRSTTWPSPAPIALESIRWLPPHRPTSRPRPLPCPNQPPLLLVLTNLQIFPFLLIVLIFIFLFLVHFLFLLPLFPLFLLFLVPLTLLALILVLIVLILLLVLL